MPDEVYGSMEDEYIFGIYEPTIGPRSRKDTYDDFEDDDPKPSKNRESYWIYAASTKKYKKPTKYSGKWLIFIEPKFIDAAWEQIKDATERGILGGQAKVSTLKSFKGDKHVICVYTYNWKDGKDVMRVREALREIGFEKPLPYKSDADTRAGKYESTGHKNISKYFE